MLLITSQRYAINIIMLNHYWRFPLKLMKFCESRVWVTLRSQRCCMLIAPIIHKIKSVLLSWIDAPVWNKYFKSSLSFTSLQVRWIADTSPTEKQVDLSSTSSCQYAKAQFASCQWWWLGRDTHSHLWVNYRFKVSKSEREREIFLRR